MFALENGQKIALSKTDSALKHLDYGYVLTNYKVQGKDAAYGIGLMESHQRFSATLKNFYVQISRAVLGMTLVTDDREALVKAIKKNSDEKAASLDIISSKQLVEHEIRFSKQNQLSIQPVIDKKLIKEERMDQKIHEIATKDLSFTKIHSPRIKELER